MKHSLYIAVLILTWTCSYTQVAKDIIHLESDKESKRVIDDHIAPFYFSQNSSEYQNVQLVKKITDILVKHNVKQIQLIGHCSDEELKTYSKVSLDRATGIKELIKAFGYHSDNIKIKDVKNTQPVDWTGNHKENQRVELIILKI